VAVGASRTPDHGRRRSTDTGRFCFLRSLGGFLRSRGGARKPAIAASNEGSAVTVDVASTPDHGRRRSTDTDRFCFLRSLGGFLRSRGGARKPAIADSNSSRPAKCQSVRYSATLGRGCNEQHFECMGALPNSVKPFVCALLMCHGTTVPAACSVVVRLRRRHPDPSGIGSATQAQRGNSSRRFMVAMVYQRHSSVGALGHQPLKLEGLRFGVTGRVLPLAAARTHTQITSRCWERQKAKETQTR
jgi:hypothetical protein